MSNKKNLDVKFSDEHFAFIHTENKLCKDDYFIIYLERITGEWNTFEH